MCIVYSVFITKLVNTNIRFKDHFMYKQISLYGIIYICTLNPCTCSSSVLKYHVLFVGSLPINEILFYMCVHVHIHLSAYCVDHRRGQVVIKSDIRSYLNFYLFLFLAIKYNILVKEKIHIFSFFQFGHFPIILYMYICMQSSPFRGGQYNLKKNTNGPDYRAFLIKQ